VDDISTVKFVYIQWVGENVKPLVKAKISTHKADLEQIFFVSFACESPIKNGGEVFGGD
jgi:hypothetical protein